MSYSRVEHGSERSKSVNGRVRISSLRIPARVASLRSCRNHPRRTPLRSEACSATPRNASLLRYVHRGS